MSAAPLHIPSNAGGVIHFESCDEVMMFAKKTSTQLAALLLVLSESESDSGMLYQSIGAANDMAFHVQMAIELLSANDSALRP